MQNIAIQLSLQQELLEYPFKPVAKESRGLKADRSAASNKCKLKHIKWGVVMVIGVIFIGYRFLWNPRTEDCIFDLLHHWTIGLNEMLNHNEVFYQVMLIIAQQAIEVNIICLCLISTWKVNNLRPHLLMGLFYGLRGILLNIERFPYPPNIRWEAPIVPSLTVPYGITRDYFYSGHTGLMLFCTMEWLRLGYRSLFVSSLILTPQVILVLLGTRVHYSIDIIAALVFIFWLQRQALKRLVLFDKFWSMVYLVIEEIVKYVKNVLN